jgi:glycosyltransferase involved in cell wall biosynthesis
VLCCYNSATKISLALKHIQEQKLPDDIDWEVIIVDNNCSDNTVDIAMETWNLNPVTSLKIVYETQPGLIYARHAGLRESTYSLICFVDDDNLLFPDYLHNMIRTFNSHPQAGIIGGISIPMFEEGADMPEWFGKFESSYAVGCRNKESGVLDAHEYVYGAGMGVRKDIWDSLIKSGYQMLLKGRSGGDLSSGEDTEMQLIYRMMGYQIFFSTDLKFHHLISAGRLKWEYLLKLKLGFGACDIILGMYRIFLSPYLPRNIIRRLWVTEISFTLLVFVGKLILFFPDSIINREGSFRTASFYHSLGRLREMWRLKDQYRILIQALADWRSVNRT